MSMPRLDGEAFRPNKSGRIYAWHGLYCPACAGHTVMIRASEGGRGSGDLTSYVAECAECKKRVDYLGTDGTIRKAVAEWKTFCRAELKKQQPGETKMKAILGSLCDKVAQTTEQLELLGTTTLIGLTPWVDGAYLVPAESGWYNVRYKMSDKEREERQPKLQRRWWNVESHSWGWPVVVGDTVSDEDLIRCQLQIATAPNAAFEWQGLTFKHPDMPKRMTSLSRQKIEEVAAALVLERIREENKKE